MNRILLLLTLFFFIIVAFPQQPVEGKLDYRSEYSRVEKIYQEAGRLSTVSDYTDEIGEKEDKLNHEALVGFKQILPAVIEAHDDSLAFYCYYKIGVLEHYFDSLELAKEHYEKAIELRSKLPSLPDSVLFRPYIYLGGIQYNLNEFDAALTNFKKAEAIASRYDIVLGGTNRLYNTLGAMYYETGNYTQAKNYFEKAISLLNNAYSQNEGLLINYKINLAATLVKLEDFDKANNIYQELLKQDINKNDILHQVGNINLRLGAGKKALEFFRQVHYNNNRIVRLYNDMGQAFEAIHAYDSARHYYLLAIEENKKWGHEIKNTQAGLTSKYLADMDVRDNHLKMALPKYQQAIIQLVNDFNDTSIYNNPHSFTSVFSYINLFYTLAAKAGAFERLYESNNDINDLKSSLYTYRTAFDLADYIEKTYDSDEARLFLNKIKYDVHSHPIDIAVSLFRLTGDNQFLEQTYMLDQENKASILSLNVRENELRSKEGKNKSLFEKEASLRSAITRLSIKATNISDSIQLSTIDSSIRDSEIQLGKVQDQIRKDPVYREKHMVERIPSTKALQKELDDQTALISYHLSDKNVLALVLTSKDFTFAQTPVTNNFLQILDSIKKDLQNVLPETRYAGSAPGEHLYSILIRPLYNKIAEKKRLIIIPDDELNYLPFEALQNENGKYLVEQFAIQYQFSTALLNKSSETNSTNNTIAFAPFARRGYKSENEGDFSALPASLEEVQNLGGKVLIDSEATIERFLTTAIQYNTIHLATHASVNNEKPQQSFITFSPFGNDRYELFASEIYNMNLDSTHLVILSACETGTGQLIRGEGLMSLSRAFAYAGCPNIITSLWKAEDKATAFLTQNLHTYLKKGIPMDIALQKAKLDLLESPEISPALKSPNYWAHLVFIGQYEPIDKKFSWWWIAIIAITMIAALIYFVRRKPGKSAKA